MSIELEKQDRVLNEVIGYKDALLEKESLEKTGQDFSSQKGNVKKTVEKLHPKRLQLVLKEIRYETPSTSTLIFSQKNNQNLPPFQAGQYINLFVNIKGVFTARPYSISSSPILRDRYELTIKRAEGGFVSPYLLDEVKVGDEFESSGPMGSFHHNPLFHGDDLVFLAGGSGIAPAMSMLNTFRASQKDFHFHIIYSNSYENDVIFMEELRKIALSEKRFTLTEFLSREAGPTYQGNRGRLTKDKLSALLDKPESKMYYICGPTPFNENAIELLTSLGVRTGRILIDGNGPPKNPETMPGWPSHATKGNKVTVKVGKGHSFQTEVGEPLLNSLERNGFSTENACRSGECSLCRVRLVSGTVFSPSEAKIRKSDKKFGYIHSCVAFPTEDISIEL
ncbi:flavodoxin reductase [Leptospira ryugenii]|uniref:Flavodoxin reductase n=1 Tax=Leptospira ryugenii TaxID=1917863 RepID=A0A2P2E1Z1_9LEPT|nr:FAD-binding oxidoreductase [Leptospira ryugenii]GBF50923.1 flavodoxin reductase [Leptospira ryugenii]